MWTAALSVASALSCLDASGNPVDWFIGIRKPASYDFIAMYPSTLAFASSAESLKGSSCAVSQTLQQLYSASFRSRLNSSSSSAAAAAGWYAYYNDQTPDGANHEENGHSKGVIGSDDTGGFWLVHSQPKWPEAVANGPYKYTTDIKYGQSFFCLSLSAATTSSVTSLFALTNPFVYDGALPSAPRRLAAGADTAHQSISTVGGVSLVQFAKTGSWDSPMYENLVSPTLQTSFMWQTWLNSPNPDGAKCAGQNGCAWSEFDIQQLAYPTGDAWSTHADHSKWGVSLPTLPPNVCIGDINREGGQWKRGGGTVCVATQEITNAFRSVVQSVDNTCTSC